MGAWSAGNFGNDDALDWLWDLYESKPDEFLEQTLSKVAKAADPEELESPDFCEALAACEIVVASLGKPASDLPDETKEWMEKHEIAGAKGLLPLAIGALSQIQTNSELKELWEESGSNDEWLQVMEDLGKRMRAANA